MPRIHARADQARRHQRVIAAIQNAVRSGDPVSVSSISRAAGVDRSFLYRHLDLLAPAHAAQIEPAAGTAQHAGVSLAALRADLANALERNSRLHARVRQLETRLSQMLGVKAWHASGLRAPADIDELQRKITRFEQAHIDPPPSWRNAPKNSVPLEANRELTRAEPAARRSAVSSYPPSE